MFPLHLQSQPPGGETESYTLSEYLANPVNNLQLFEVVASAVVFQFVPVSNKDIHAAERVLPYYDKLNSWLGQILQRDIGNVPIELCDIEQCGVAIRICPLENPEEPPTSEDIANIMICLEQQMVRRTSNKSIWSAMNVIYDSFFFFFYNLYRRILLLGITSNVKDIVSAKERARSYHWTDTRR